MTANLEQIISDPVSTLLIVGNLILIESLLSVDNAAVLATMVMDLPYKQRKKALKYGIIGAYVFRGICLALATYLVQIWWLKGAGGLYLVYLAVNWWLKKRRKGKDTHQDAIRTEKKLYRMTVGRIGKFWATVISVEIMDLAFSLDNVFAAVAFSDNILIVLLGVFIGILAMRFVAQFFVRLIDRYPFLEACAFFVIGLLGIKLVLSFYEHYHPAAPVTRMLQSETADWLTSALTICIFVIPILSSAFLGFPKKKED